MGDEPHDGFGEGQGTKDELLDCTNEGEGNLCFYGMDPVEERLRERAGERGGGESSGCQVSERVCKVTFESKYIHVPVF